MPDGDLEISDKINNLTKELLKMLTSSCMNAMENHLLMKDLRVGKFSDTLTGVSTLRHIYRTLRSRLRDGTDIKLGHNSEDFKNYMKSAAGESIMSAESLLEACKKLNIEFDSEIDTDNIELETKAEPQPQPDIVVEDLDNSGKRCVESVDKTVGS